MYRPACRRDEDKTPLWERCGCGGGGAMKLIWRVLRMFAENFFYLLSFYLYQSTYTLDEFIEFYNIYNILFIHIYIYM
jgi:hypothetical protein